MGQRWLYGRRFWNRKGALRFLAVLLMMGILGAGAAVTAQLRPLLSNLATAKVSNTVSRVVAEAVSEAISSGEIEYEKLVSFEKDREGKITAVYSNIALFNDLQGKILDRVLGRVEQISTRELAIPVGTLTGSALLAGRGPRIRVRMDSLGSSEATFHNEFLSAGINQTKHQIVLTVDVFVSILLPGFTTATKVSNSFIVAETIIVGSVPDSYTYFSVPSEEYESDAKDYALNQD